MMTDLDPATLLANRVEMGAALLDATYPRWHEAINLDHLSMDNVRTCVLGQVYGDYMRGIDALDLYAGEISELHGFTLVTDIGGAGDWEVLGHLWAREVRRRREGWAEMIRRVRRERRER